MNRMAVYRRMSRTKCVDAELALRYWHSHGNLSDYCTIVLATCASYRDAWCLEHSGQERMRGLDSGCGESYENGCMVSADFLQSL